MTKHPHRVERPANRFVFLCSSCLDLHHIPHHELFQLPDEGWETCEWCCSRARFLADVQGARRA